MSVRFLKLNDSFKNIKKKIRKTKSEMKKSGAKSKLYFILSARIYADLRI